MLPEWCKAQDTWNDLCDYFSSEEFNIDSNRNRENRTKSGSQPGHFGGSASATKHRDQMVKLEENLYTILINF